MVPVVVIVGCEVEVRLAEDGVVVDDVVGSDRDEVESTDEVVVGDEVLGCNVSVVDVAKLVSVEGKLALLENLIHVAVLSS